MILGKCLKQALNKALETLTSGPQHVETSCPGLLFSPPDFFESLERQLSVIISIHKLVSVVPLTYTVAPKYPM